MTYGYGPPAPTNKERGTEYLTRLSHLVPKQQRRDAQGFVTESHVASAADAQGLAVGYLLLALVDELAALREAITQLRGAMP